jgi:hypothetical protein
MFRAKDSLWTAIRIHYRRISTHQISEDGNEPNEVGRKVRHYIEDGGKFVKACAMLF